MKKIFHVTLLLFSLSICQLYGGEIYIDFNGNSVIHNAAPGKKVSGTAAQYIDNQSILISGKNRVWVPSCGMLRSDSGTIELTLTVLNWKSGNSQYLFYARQNKGNDVLMIQGRNGKKLAFYMGKLPGSFNMIEVDINWQANSKHVIKATWNRNFLVLYLDGKAVGKCKRTHNDLKWSDPIWLGGTIWGGGDSESALDHFRLSDQCEIKDDPAQAKRSPAAAVQPKPAGSNDIYIDFNGNTIIRNAKRGEIVSGTPPRFADENSVIISGKNRLWVPSCGKLRSDAGTIEMILTVRDWKVGNSQYLFYARQNKGNDILMIQGRNGDNLIFYIGKLPGKNQVEAKINWAPGTKHVIKATWDRNYLALYLDGKLAAKGKRTFNDLKWADPMWLGGTIWAPGDSESALDHFRLSSQSDFNEDPQYANLASGTIKKFPELADNIATEAHLVTLIPGSQFKPDKSKCVEMVLDRIPNTYYLSEKGAPTGNHYIEVIWPAGVTARAVRITPAADFAPLGGTLSKKELDGTFTKITEFKKFGQVINFAPVKTEVLRFDFIPGSAGQIGIAELEVAGAAPRLFLPKPQWGGYFLWPQRAASQVNFYRREFDIADVSKITMAHFQLSADDSWDLYVNGKKLGVGGFAVKVFDLLPHLVNGNNTIAIRAENFSGPAGLLAELTLAESGKSLRKICSDNQWQRATTPSDNWFVPGDKSSSYVPAERSPSLATYAENMPYMIPGDSKSTVLKVEKIQGLAAETAPGTTCRGSIYVKTLNKLDADYGFRIILGEEALSQNCDYTLAAIDVMPAIPTSKWQVNKLVKLDFEFTIPSWAPHGLQPLRMVALSKKGALPVGFDQTTQVMVKRSEKPVQVSSTPATCKIELVNNQMRAVVNGEIMPPMIFALNSSFTTYTQLGSEYRVPSGLYRFTPAQCSLYVPEGMDKEKFFADQMKAVDQQIRQVLRFHPNAKLLIPLNCRINYARSNPSEAVTLSNGDTLMYSFSSDQYLQETIDGGTRIIKHMLNSDYAGAIAGFLIISGAGGETMFWGYTFNRNRLTREKLVLGDFSPPAQRKFREFLRRRYQNDVNRLRAAWKNNTVNFDNAKADIEVLRQTERFNFRDPASGSMAMDYWDFHSDSVADSVMAIAKAFRKASNGKSLIGTWGFYSFAVYPAICLMQHGGLHHIGAMSLDKLMECKDIDFFACIQAYSGVRGNTLLNTTMPAATMKKHRKLFIEEFDVRTFLVDLIKIPDHHTTSEFETVNVMKRDFGETLAQGYTAWFCGFSRGYTGRAARGWFSADVLTDLITQMNNIGKAMSSEKIESAAEVALFINNRDIAAMDVMTAAGIMNSVQKNSVYGRFRGPSNCEAIKSCGVPYDLYLLSDFSPELVKKYKFIVMLHSFYLDKATRDLIRTTCEKQKKQVMWLFAPGYVEKGGKSSPENISALTGITVKEALEIRDDLRINVDAPGFIKHAIAVANNPYTGKKIQVGPVFSVNDPQAQVIGRYQHNGQAALAIKEVNGMRSIYCALPLVTRDLFIEFCRRANVHIYTNAPMALSVNSKIIAAQAPIGCNTVIKLPKKQTVLDLYSRKIVAKNTDSFKLELQPQVAVLYYTGSDEEVKNMLKKTAPATVFRQ